MLNAVHPSDLHEYWELIQPELAYCLSQEDTGVWPEDVYACIKSGEATLYLERVNSVYHGMVIVTIHLDPWSKEKSLHIWLARSSNGCKGLGNLALEELNKIACTIGAKSLTLRTSNEAVKTWSKQRQFEVSYVELSRKVSTNGSE
jgi:hypothetical protein